MDTKQALIGLAFGCLVIVGFAVAKEIKIRDAQPAQSHTHSLTEQTQTAATK